MEMVSGLYPACSEHQKFVVKYRSTLRYAGRFFVFSSEGKKILVLKAPYHPDIYAGRGGLVYVRSEAGTNFRAPAISNYCREAGKFRKKMRKRSFGLFDRLF